MADEPVKQPQNTGAPVNPASTGQTSPFPKKKRRRRPRRRKPRFPGQEQQAVFTPAAEKEGGLLEPVKTEVVKAEPAPEPVPAPLPEPEPEPEPEPVAEPEPIAEPVSEPEPEITEAETAVEPPAEEQKAEEGPSPFANALKPEEAATAPQGWNQLKEAIKQDHEITKEKLAAGAGAAAAVVTLSEPLKDDKKTSKNEKNNVEIPKLTPEEEQERKEVFGIIVRYVLSGCVIIAIIGGLVFFKLPQMAFDAAKNFFTGSQGAGQQTQQEDVEVPTGNETESPSVNSSILAGENKVKSKETFEQGVETALVTGQDVPKLREPTSAVSTVFMIGYDNKEFTKEDFLGAYMVVLTRLQNAFKTDIHEMLSKAPDRAEALENHINDLKTVQTDAEETITEINEKMDEIKVEYNQVSTLKDRLEKDFFNAMDKLEGSTANEILDEFMEVSKRYTELKAQYSALDKTSKLFKIALENMEIRIKDIEYNRDALIKGVKVVDIKGSDLDLIIQESEL